MQTYRPRAIRFKEVLQLSDWNIKIYTISKTGAFDHGNFYSNALAKLPTWLELKNSFDDAHDRLAFLILHAGTEGIFSLINWWVGGNMLNTHIFLTEYKALNTFTRISGDGLAPCIWELEIINHERISWINNVMKQNPSNYGTYMQDVTNLDL